MDVSLIIDLLTSNLTRKGKENLLEELTSKCQWLDAQEDFRLGDQLELGFRLVDELEGRL